MEIPVKKNEKYIVNIIDNGINGEGIAKIDGFTVFVPRTIKGEKCEVLIVKVLSSHAFGKLVNLIEKSDARVEEDCSTYKKCGGCELRHMTYEETLILKKNNVQNLINKELTSKVEISEIIGMEKPFYYRNKAIYPVGTNSDGKANFGVFAKMSHTIIPIEHCFIQTEISQKIARFIINFIQKNNISVYSEEKVEGIFRHIIIKVGKNTDEVMCILVVNKSKIPKEEELVKGFLQEFPQIKTIVKNINNQNTNVILGKEEQVLYGSGYIEDILGKYKFKISSKSFYQVNPVQAEKLYNKAIEMTNLNNKDILFDLYCGIGTIGIFASKYVNKVYGIEIIPEAIEDAKENAKINNIKNIEFIVGDVEEAFDNLINKNKIEPTAIIVDPPRKGLDNKTIENILKVLPKKLTYISCNPATMVRDLKKLEEKYEIKEIKAVDMFPYTTHCEVVSVLKLKK